MKYGGFVIAVCLVVFVSMATCAVALDDGENPNILSFEQSIERESEKRTSFELTTIMDERISKLLPKPCSPVDEEEQEEENETSENMAIITTVVNDAQTLANSPENENIASNHGTQMSVPKVLAEVAKDSAPVLAIIGLGSGLLYAIAAKMVLIPLHTTLKANDILNNENRKKIYDVIVNNPGICMRGVYKKTGIGWSSVVYHVSVLANRDFIGTTLTGSLRGSRKPLFENNNTYRSDEKQFMDAIKNETASSIIKFILNKPGTTQKQICESMDYSSALVSWHTKQLETRGILCKERDGRVSRHYITGNFDADAMYFQ